MDKVVTKGREDDSKDWVGVYEKVLDDIGWRNATKFVIHIADTPIYRKIFI